MRQRAAVLRQILPRGAEWREIDRASDRDVILDWLRQCVGLTQPVLAITLANPNASPLAVTAVRYVLVGAAVGCGPPPETSGPITSTAIYAHGLRTDYSAPRTVVYHVQTAEARAFLSSWGVSEYDSVRSTERVPEPERFPLVPAFGLGPRAQGAFELQIYSPTENHQLWPVLMAIELETDAGLARTPEFWIDFPLSGTC